MIYERIKTGTFRVCVVFTIVLEILIIQHPPNIGIFESDEYELYSALILAPIFIWGTFYTSLWIINGYIGKK